VLNAQLQSDRLRIEAGYVAALEEETTVVDQVHGQLQVGNLKRSGLGPLPAGETVICKAHLSSVEGPIIAHQAQLGGQQHARLPPIPNIGEWTDP
jgi:hypothetical protein